MSDIIKSINELSLEQVFEDFDTRTITVPNPNTDINLKSAINDLSSYMAENQVTIGDKTGAKFARIKSAKIKRSVVTYYDLTPQ